MVLVKAAMFLLSQHHLQMLGSPCALIGAVHHARATHHACRGPHVQGLLVSSPLMSTPSSEFPYVQIVIQVIHEEHTAGYSAAYLLDSFGCGSTACVSCNCLDPAVPRVPGKAYRCLESARPVPALLPFPHMQQIGPCDVWMRGF